MEAIEFITLFSCPKYYTFGSKEGQPLSTSVTSRSRSRKSTNLSTDVITVSGGTYQLKVGGVWQTATTSPGTWGTATAIRAIGTSSVFYSVPSVVAVTINGVVDNFTITTLAGVDLLFTTGSYGSTWTPPTITAASLADGDVTWMCPDGSTFTGKTPAMTSFSQIGSYRCHVTNWAAVTAISFYVGTTPRNFLIAINLNTVFPLTTSLTTFSLQKNNFLVENITNWVFPASITSLNNSFEGCNRLTGSIPSLSNLTNLNNLASAFSSCTTLTGSIPSLSANTLLTTLAYAFNGCIGLTGSIPSLSTNTQINTLVGFVNGCVGLTGSIPSLSTNTLITTIAYAFYNCNQLSGSLPSLNSNTLLTTMIDAFYSDVNLTSDVSTWTWRSNITNATLRNTHFTYGTGQALRTNVKNGLVFDMSTCNLTQTMVDAVLVDLDTSAATGLVVTLNGSGNAAPSATGTTAKNNIVGKGGTVTVNT